MTATRTRKVASAAKNTEKKAPQPIENRFRGQCAECSTWVGVREGVATPPTKTGEKWSTHHGHIADNGSAVIGPCPKPATVKNRRKNEKKEDTMPVRRRTTRKPAPAPKIETFSAEDIAALSLVDLRALAKELGLDEQMKKVGILNELIEKGHLIEEGEESTPAPAKKTTPRKRVAAKTESASADDEEPQEDDEMASSLADMMAVIKAQIESGVLDTILGDIDDAISSRLDAVAKEDAAAKKTAAKKTTTPARSRSEKLAPVTRKKAAAAPVDESAEGDDDTLTEGKIYNLKGKSLAGARGKFMGYKDGDDTRAIVVLTKAHGQRPKGAKISISVRSIEV